MSDRQLFNLKLEASMARHKKRRQQQQQQKELNKLARTVMGGPKSHFSKQVEYRQVKRCKTNLNDSTVKKSPPSNKLLIDKKKLIIAKNRGENLSFCGCGFLGIYHVGVATSFQKYAPQLSGNKVAGSSAGALAAVAHMCGESFLDVLASDFIRVAVDSRSRSLGPFHPSFDINAILLNSLDRNLPDDVHLRASGRLHISVTRLDNGENVIINNFESKEEVIQAIICSCFIPIWSGLVAPKFKGVSYTDGGFTKNILILDDKTIAVSPFAGEADICPQDDVNNLQSFCVSNSTISLTAHNLQRFSNAFMPPPTEVLNELCARGFADGIKFLHRMNFISFNACVEIRSSFIVTDIIEEEITEIIEEETKGFYSSVAKTDNNTNGSDTHYERGKRRAISGLLQMINEFSSYRKNFNSRLNLKTTTTTTETATTLTSTSTGCFVNGLLATAAASGERIVIDIERTLPLLIDSIPLYPFFYACASTTLLYLMECLRSGAKVGEKHQRRILKLVQYFSI